MKKLKFDSTVNRIITEMYSDDHDYAREEGEAQYDADLRDNVSVDDLDSILGGHLNRPDAFSFEEMIGRFEDGEPLNDFDKGRITDSISVLKQLEREDLAEDLANINVNDTAATLQVFNDVYEVLNDVYSDLTRGQ